jgi:hypothetical protein
LRLDFAAFIIAVEDRMGTAFQIDLKDMKDFQKLLQRFPYKIQRASAGTLNSVAFGMRQSSLMVINEKMTVRSPSFIRSKLSVSKASNSHPIETQKAIMGSILSERFSGWKEQELGSPTSMHRTATLLARGGSMAGKIQTKSRLKGNFQTPDDFPGKNKEHRIYAMLSMLSRKRYGNPIIIYGHSKWKPGLYKLKYKGKKSYKIHRLQEFKAPLQPKRVKWMTMAVHKQFASNPVSEIWVAELTRQLKQ